jgi:general L-amino acid transport system permease protein
MPTALTSIWTDRKKRAFLIQGLVLVVLVFVVGTIVSNTATNLEKRGITSGLGFLSQPAGFDIVQTLVPWEMSMSHGRVLLIGILNTLLVSVLGIIAATIIGVTIGIARLSDNWLISRLAGTYVEILRNLPLLLQVYFWYGMTLLWPKVRESFDIGGVIFVNNRGIELPVPRFQDGAELILASLFAAVMLASVFWKWAGEVTGEGPRRLPFNLPRGLLTLVILIGIPVLMAALTGFPWEWDVPTRKGFNYRGGLTILPSLVALWFALATYTACYIGETVRSGIQSVSRGQREAALSLGLRPSWIMRIIVLPQALRVILPQMISQYLNLVKNSSLAVAIGYPEIMSVFAGTSLSQTGQAVEIILITMMFYLTVSLTISFFMNIYNKRVALRGGVAQ